MPSEAKAQSPPCTPLGGKNCARVPCYFSSAVRAVDGDRAFIDSDLIDSDLIGLKPNEILPNHIHYRLLNTNLVWNLTTRSEMTTESSTCTTHLDRDIPL
jgi:hypothetical protein